MIFRIGLLCVLIFSCTSLGEDQVSRKRGNSEHNDLFVESNSLQSVDVTATRTLRSVEGKRLKTSFSVAHFPWWRLRRLARASSRVSGLQFRFGLVGLVEYEESSNGTDGLDYSDRVLQRIAFWDGSWSTLNESTEIGEGRVQYRLYSSQFQPSSASGNVLLSSGVADKRAWIGGIDRILAPSSWEWEIGINDIELQGNRSRLALKLLIESNGTKPLFRSNIAIAERDNYLEQEDDLLILAPQSLVTVEDRNDIGYFCWKKEAVDIGGKYPEIDSVLIDSNTGARSLRTVSSPILSENQDIAPFADSASVLDDPQGRVDGESRYYMYVSFMVTNPRFITWDPYVGVDEPDPPTTTSDAVRTCLLIPLFLLCHTLAQTLL